MWQLITAKGKVWADVIQARIAVPFKEIGYCPWCWKCHNPIKLSPGACSVWNLRLERTCLTHTKKTQPLLQEGAYQPVSNSICFKCTHLPPPPKQWHIPASRPGIMLPGINLSGAGNFPTMNTEIVNICLI